MVDPLAAQQPREHVEPLVEHRRAMALVRVLAEPLELRCVAAEAGAEDDPAAAQDRQRREVLRDHMRPPPRAAA